jgi:pentatricopeptide repeat protein
MLLFCKHVQTDAIDTVHLVAALQHGRHIHSPIIQRGYESDIFVATSLIDMYAKCGSIEDASRVFDKMPTCEVHKKVHSFSR